MNKFKLTWCERVCDEDGDTLYHENKSQIIEAENEDAACDQWEKENEHNENQNGLDDCVEVIESLLFKKNLIVTMPNGVDYAVPVEFIARDRAEHYANEYDGNISESLKEDTIPLFESDEFEIRDWALNNLNWSDVKRHAVMLVKKMSEHDFQEGWVNGEYKIS